MKKISRIAILALVFLSLAACQKQDEKSSSSSEEEVTASSDVKTKEKTNPATITIIDSSEDEKASTDSTDK